MAELDYAYLADYAAVENGKLMAIGASYTHAKVRSDGGLWITSIAGRVKMRMGDAPVALGIRIVGPNSAFEVEQNEQLEPGPDARPYDGDKIGVLFAVTVVLPTFSSGLYEVFIELDSVVARRLAFDMSEGQ